MPVEVTQVPPENIDVSQSGTINFSASSSGLQGAQGPIGPVGPQGPVGDQGLKGDPGTSPIQDDAPTDPLAGQLWYDADEEPGDVFGNNRAEHIGTQSSSTISDFTEAVQDAVAAMLSSGTNVTLTYNDVDGTLQVSAEGGDAEVMRDTIGAALSGVGEIAVNINDAGDTIIISTTATANDTNANLRNRSTHTGTQSLDTTTDSTTRWALSSFQRNQLVGATSANNANTIVQRDNQGDVWVRNISVGLPTEVWHAARKSYVDGLVTPVTTDLSAGTDASGPGTLVRRHSTNGSITVPTVYASAGQNGGASSLTRKDYVDGQVGTRAPLTTTIDVKNADYTLVLTDAGKQIDMTSNAVDMSLTIPLNSSVAFPIGTTIEIGQGGVRPATIVGVAGVVVQSRSSAFKTNGIYAMAAIRKTDTDTWRVIGDVVV